MIYHKSRGKKLTVKKLRIFWKKETIFNSMWLLKLIKQCMRHGKLELMEKVIYKSLKLLKNITVLGLFYFFECIFIVKPIIILRWVRKGRFFYQVARPIHEELQLRMGCFFLAKFLRIKWRRKELTLAEKLYSEIFNVIFTKKSKILDFRNDIYNIAEYNMSMFRHKW